jgi:hypothetical protein
MLNKDSKRTYVGDFTAEERKNETKFKKKGRNVVPHSSCKANNGYQKLK